LVPYSEDRIHILENALDHYSDRLLELAQDRETIPSYLQNAYVEKDLMNESTKALDLKRNLNKLHGDLSVQALDYEDGRKLACCAIKCYLNDLRKSVSVAKEKLGGAEPTFEQVDKEISEAEKYYELICNQGK
jgi:hypothetical protein